MPEMSPELGSFAPVKVLLVDLDPIFRSGLKSCLEESPEFEVMGDFGRSSEILQRLEAMQSEVSDLDVSNPCPVDLLVWSMDIRRGQAMTVGLPQVLRSRYPKLPLCILLGNNDSWLLEELWQSSIEGCWLKDANQAALLSAMGQIAAGQKVWDARLLSQLSASGASQKMKPVKTKGVGATVNRIRQSLGDRGLRELETGLETLDTLLAGPGLGVWERLVLEGRFREMQAARRLVQSVILPSDSSLTGRTREDRNAVVTWPTAREREAKVSGVEAVRLQTAAAPSSNPEKAIAVPSPLAVAESVEVVPPMTQPLPNVVVSENDFQTYKGVLIETVIAKLSQSLQNLTSEPLEIDILSLSKRQELFFIILRLIEETLDDLRFSQLTPGQLSQQRSQILQEIWQRATADFYGKYSMLPVSSQQGAEVQLVPILLEDMSAVEGGILAKIPWVEEWIAHLLFQTPIQVENQPAETGSPAAMRQSEAMLENLMIRIANAVVAPLLNQFGSSEVVKQNFYDRRWISTREIERFRNSLSWKYRMDQFFGDPKDIFESQVPMLVLSEVGIRRQAVYQPRDAELQQLKGIPLLVTLALEARDAVAPPLRASFTWVGRGVVYLLTQVVGRGIGLIGRGIIQGVGTAWQETRQPKGDRTSDDRFN